MIRVLIVDDSPTMRMLVRNALETDPEIQVVGEAMDGERAVALAHALKPDLITMDIQMPKLNGYQAIERIMAETPRPIIVLTSSKSEMELGISFRAMEVGALAVIAKPKGRRGQDPEADKLISHVKAMAGVKVIRRQGGTSGSISVLSRPASVPKPKGGVEIIAIGASTGGPPALQVILLNLALDLDLPVVIVQHISQGFVAGLARWLDDTTPWKVMVAQKYQRLKPKTVYLAPDGFHLRFLRCGQIHLDNSPPLGGHRPSATALFEAVAGCYQHRAIGVLLTGMGRDGADGLQVLHSAGATTIAQDEASSVIFGMPKQAILLGAASLVLPLDKIGLQINALVGAGLELKK